jgi:shikimate 5-dehydrogenase
MSAEPRLTEHERALYARQLRLPGVGESGQLKLRAAKVLLLGAGGLGSPVGLYLAAAGVGTIGLAAALAQPALRVVLLERDPDLLERFAQLVNSRRRELESLGDEEQQREASNLLEAMRNLFFALGGG